MPTIIVQFTGLVVLLGGIGAGYMRFVRPRAGELDLQARGLLVLLIVTMVGGLVGSTGWWMDSPQAFSWDLPPLASRMLGAAAIAFAWLNLLTLHKPSWGRVRLALIMLVIYLGPLAVAIVLFHLDRFDAEAPITYTFFLVVIGMTVSGLWYLVRQPVIIPHTENSPPPPLTLRWLMSIAALLGVWGLALFVTASGTDAIWVWPGDLLTSRLIGVMLLALACGALYSLRSDDLACVMLSMLVIYGAGVVLANVIQLVGDKPVKPVYAGVFGAMALVSAILLWRDQQVL